MTDLPKFNRDERCPKCGGYPPFVHLVRGVPEVLEVRCLCGFTFNRLPLDADRPAPASEFYAGLDAREGLYRGLCAICGVPESEHDARNLVLPSSAHSFEGL